MIKHQQEELLVAPGLGNPFIQRIVAGAPGEQHIKPGPQAVTLHYGWCRSIGDQLTIEGPVLRPESGQQVAMNRHNRGQFGIMAGIVDPAECVGVGQQVIDGCIITQQAPHDRHARLRVIGCNRQGVPDLLALLGIEDHPGTIQLVSQLRGAQVGVPWECGTQLGEQGPADAASFQPSQGVGIQPEARFLAPQHRQHILAGAARTGLIDRKEGIAEHMGAIVPLPIAIPAS